MGGERRNAEGRDRKTRRYYNKKRADKRMKGGARVKKERQFQTHKWKVTRVIEGSMTGDDLVNKYCVITANPFVQRYVSMCLTTGCHTSALV